MTVDGVANLLRAIAGLIGAFVWPALVLFIIVRFRTPIGAFMDKFTSLRVKGAGFDITAQIEEKKASAFAAAVQANTGRGAASADDPVRIQRTIARALPDLSAERRLAHSRVLWVDDRPDNNRYERQAMEALGLTFELSLDTDAALARMQAQSFDLVISDMGRPGDPRAGYTLLDHMRMNGNRTPFVIYAGSRDPAHVREAVERGALGTTNSPSELISLVTDALSRR